MTVWPLFTYLLNFDGLLGFLTGAALFGICNLAGAPVGVQTVGALTGGVVWIASWLRTSIKFTADDLVVTMLLRPCRIPWARVERVTMLGMCEDDADSDRVTRRRLEIRYRRDASTSADPVPAVFSEYRAWAQIHVRTLSLPLTFPPAADSMDSNAARAPRTWMGRHANRQREVIRREFAARGYSFPD